MAKVTRTSPEFLRRFCNALVTELRKTGIRAEVKTEPVRATKLHRIMVIAGKFEHLKPSERQNLVWRIASQVLTPEQQLRISMIVTVTPDELVAA